MIRRVFAALLPLLAASGAAPPPEERPLQYAQAVVRQQVIIRYRQVPTAAAVQWKEGKKFKCVPAAAILGASLISQQSVDLILKDRRRVRAGLESSCPALDYYYGFYIRPNADGMICADRDVIRSRMGGECGIDRFRTLEPIAKRPVP
ncbi:MAG TPA: hypothetical protein VGB59_06045 [Allosphingosinicella sp.]|jgi:hypothetical protein